MNKLVRSLAWIAAGAAAGVACARLTKKKRDEALAPQALRHSGTRTIETKRLILRRFKAEDAGVVYENWASDPEVTKFLTWQPHVSPEATAEVLEDWEGRYENGAYYHWAIVLKELGEPIGSISVVDQNDTLKKAHIGYCIGRRWWHQGIMTEALSAVIQYLFSEGYQRIDSRHDPNNPHSGDVMKKCGMKYEGTLRNYDWNNQGYCDACFYSILAEEYKEGGRSL